MTVVIITRFGPQPMETVWEQGGLAVHRDFWGGTGGPEDDDGGWTVTHARSGFAVRRSCERDEAIALAAALVALDVDWTQDYGATVADDALYAAARKVARQFHWPLPSKRVMDARRKRALEEFAS